MPHCMFDRISIVDRCDAPLLAASRRLTRRLSEKQPGPDALVTNRRKLADVFTRVFAHLVFFDQSSGIDAVLSMSAASSVTLAAIGVEGVQHYFAVQRAILRNLRSLVASIGLADSLTLVGEALRYWKAKQRFPLRSMYGTQVVADILMFTATATSSIAVTEAVKECYV